MTFSSPLALEDQSTSGEEHVAGPCMYTWRPCVQSLTRVAAGASQGRRDQQQQVLPRCKSRALSPAGGGVCRLAMRLLVDCGLLTVRHGFGLLGARRYIEDRLIVGHLPPHMHRGRPARPTARSTDPIAGAGAGAGAGQLHCHCLQNRAWDFKSTALAFLTQ